MTKSSVLFPVLLCATAAFAQQPRTAERSTPVTQEQKVKDEPATANSDAAQAQETISLGRIGLIGETSSERLGPAALIAPGAPPILAFRYFDGQARHRFGELDLVLDDAGH